MSTIIYCKNCNLKFPQPPHSGKRTFCSRSCATKYNKSIGKCPGGPAPSKGRKHYLSMKRKHQADRRARQLNQTPPNADNQIIKEIYLNCPKGYEIDHIIPLSRGGLHHQDNLQYLTPTENRKKGNRI